MDNYEIIMEMLKAKVKEPENISLEATIRDLGLDSLDLVDLMLDLETKLDISFKDEELLGLKTVQDTVNLLNIKTNKEGEE